MMAAEILSGHCGFCRRWSSGAWMTVACDPAIEIEDGAALAFYGSLDHTERGFCRNCGTSLFWRMRGSSLLAVSAQTFEQPNRFRFASKIFINKKPNNYSSSNNTEKLSEAEVLAQCPNLADGLI